MSKYFKPTGIIYPHRDYKEGGSFFNSTGYNNILFGEVCGNCGLPYGKHGGWEEAMCLDKYASLMKPYFIKHISETIKIL